MQSRKGFTLIELLVVIAIIGILATIVTLQVAGAQVRSRNSRAQSDISQIGKAIEVYKTNQSNAVPAQTAANVSLSIGGTGTSSMAANVQGSAVSASWLAIFTGTESLTTIGVKINSSPSSEYVYNYGTNAGGASYCVATNARTVTGATVTGFMINDGASNSTAALVPSFGPVGQTPPTVPCS